MVTFLIVICLLCLFFFVIPKFTTGRILYSEGFVPEFQVFRMLKKRELREVPVRIRIVYRKLYRFKFFLLFKPIFELLPSSYSVKPNKDGLFIFWAYPFDIVHIFVGEDMFRMTCTLRHKVDYFASKVITFFTALASLFYPKLLHDECIEIPTTLGKTSGYSDKLSALPGEELKLMISTKQDKISLEFIRVGQTLEKMEEINNIPGSYQTIETKFPSVFGCGWKPTINFRIPGTISSGCYLIKLKGNSNDDTSYIPVIIKPQKIKNQIAVIASTNTWHAYNSWGGHNYYINYTAFPSAYIINMQRPFDLYLRNPIEESCQNTRDHLLVGERFLWAWLEREEFGYDLYTDMALHSSEDFNNYLKRYKIIIISTHNEYWSYEMIDHLKEFMKNEGNVVSLSGNTIFKEIKYIDQNLMILDGAYFRYQDFYEEAILGVSHDLRGFATWAPYKVVQSDHWAFEGTNLKNGAIIGREGLNISPKGVSGASGWETDKISSRSPQNTTLLAKGTNPKCGGADMIIYQEPGRGHVFSVGSITYGGSLLVDDNISQITKNVILKFLK